MTGRPSLFARFLDSAWGKLTVIGSGFVAAWVFMTHSVDKPDAGKQAHHPGDSRPSQVKRVEVPQHSIKKQLVILEEEPSMSTTVVIPPRTVPHRAPDDVLVEGLERVDRVVRTATVVRDGVESWNDVRTEHKAYRKTIGAKAKKEEAKARKAAAEAEKAWLQAERYGRQTESLYPKKSTKSTTTSTKSTSSKTTKPCVKSKPPVTKIEQARKEANKANRQRDQRIRNYNAAHKY